MRCDNCFHKEVCIHFTNINNGTYGVMRYKFNPELCVIYVNADNVTSVIHAHRGINIGMRSYCSNCGHLAYCENYCSFCGAKMNCNNVQQ